MADNTAELATLTHAIALFVDDEAHGFHFRCALFDLTSRHVKGDDALERAKLKTSSDIQHDLWQIACIASRVNWTAGLVTDGQLDAGLARSHLELDIDFYHVRFRTMLDRLAAMISLYAAKPGQLPSSFAKQRQFAGRSPLRMPPGIPELLVQAGWFDELRAIRDHIIHGGGCAMAFYPDEQNKFLYQIHRPDLRGMVSNPILLFNENVAKFDHFVAWSMSRALVLLDRVGEALGGEIDPEELGGSRSYSPGYAELRDWMVNLRNALQTTDVGECVA